MSKQTKKTDQAYQSNFKERFDKIKKQAGKRGMPTDEKFLDLVFNKMKKKNDGKVKSPMSQRKIASNLRNLYKEQGKEIDVSRFTAKFNKKKKTA